MIKFCEKGRFRHDKLKLDVNNLVITFHDERYKRGSIGYVHHQLDLKQLESIQLLYEFPDHEKRRQAAESKTNENRAQNAVLGAVAGAGIDMLIGDDDSILDGALVGAALGAAVTPVEKIDLTEQKEHFLLLLFKNGDSYKFIVDASGLADLLRALHKARKNYLSEQAGDPVFEVPLSPAEIRIAESAAKQNFIDDNKPISFFLTLGLLAAAAIFLLYFLADALFSFTSFIAATTGDVEPRETMSTITIGIFAAAGAVWLGIICFVGSIEEKKAKAKIDEGEGKPKVIKRSLVADSSLASGS